MDPVSSSASQQLINNTRTVRPPSGAPKEEFERQENQRQTASLPGEVVSLNAAPQKQGVTYNKAGFIGTLTQAETRSEPVEGSEKKDSPSADSSSTTRNTTELTPQDLKEIEVLKKRDAEVRAHEQAHANVGGPYAGSPTYDYTTGPDGKRYAVGGQVKIDISKVEGNPEATLQKANQVREAALAPADPSAQDRRVAAEASRLAQEAKIEIREEKLEPSEAQTEELPSDGATSTLEEDAEVSIFPDSSKDDGETNKPSTEFEQSVAVQDNSLGVSSASLQPVVVSGAVDNAEDENDSESSDSEANSGSAAGDATIGDANQLLVDVTEQNKAIELFEATQALYQNLEDRGGVRRSGEQSGGLVNTLV